MLAHQSTVEADFWHVALAPGETKVLTLEQLDDLFRLDIIDAATRVWQPGMSEWLPLSVVAGLEAEPSTPKAPPPAPSSRAPARPPSPPQRPAATASFGVAPARPASVQPAPSFQPTASFQPTPSFKPAPSFQPTPSFQPAPVAAAWPGAAAPNQSVRPAPESFRPMVVSHRPAPAPSGGGAAGRFVLALALIAGVGVTLYRNDVLRRAAVSYGQEKTYLKVEAALGGPGFGTPRAVQLAAPTSLNAAAAEAAAQTSPPATRQAETPPSIQEPARPSEPSSNSASAASPTPVSLSSLVAAKMPSPKAKAERAATPAAAARPAARAASAGAAQSRDLGIKGSSNGYDPLNGKL
jgi:hypothetical protein